MNVLYKIFFIFICVHLQNSIAGSRNRSASISRISSTTPRASSLAGSNIPPVQMRAKKPYQIADRQSRSSILQNNTQPGTIAKTGTAFFNVFRRAFNTQQFHIDPKTAKQHSENLTFYTKDRVIEPTTRDLQDREKEPSEIIKEKFTNTKQKYEKAQSHIEKAIQFLNKQETKSDDATALRDEIKQFYTDYKNEFEKIKTDSNLPQKEKSKIDETLADIDKQLQRFDPPSKSSTAKESETKKITDSVIKSMIDQKPIPTHNLTEQQLQAQLKNIGDPNVNSSSLLQPLSPQTVRQSSMASLTNSRRDSNDPRFEFFSKTRVAQKLKNFGSENQRDQTRTPEDNLKKIKKEIGKEIDITLGINHLKKIEGIIRAQGDNPSPEVIKQYQETLTHTLINIKKPEIKKGEYSTVKPDDVNNLIQYRNLMQICEALGIKKENSDSLPTSRSIEAELKKISDAQIIYPSKSGLILDERKGRDTWNDEDSKQIIKDIHEALGKTPQQINRAVALRKLYDLVRRYPYWIGATVAVLTIVLGNVLNQTL